MPQVVGADRQRRHHLKCGAGAGHVLDREHPSSTEKNNPRAFLSFMLVRRQGGRRRDRPRCRRDRRRCPASRRRDRRVAHRAGTRRGCGREREPNRVAMAGPSLGRG